MGREEARRHVRLSVPPLHPLNAHSINSSDADSDVLADYVLALIRAETPEPELRLSAVANLEDFLQDSTCHEIITRTPSIGPLTETA